MKKLLLVLATILVSTPPMAESQMKNEITDSFTDKVKMIREEEKEIVVQFTRHASLYKMPKSNPRYEELKTKLEKLKKEEKKVKVVAILPMMEIKDLNE
jgi:biopolymer transport protein ExbD